MADSNYVIDIAATLRGDETIAQLDRLTENLVGAGRRSDDFQAAIRRVSAELDAAKSAADAANAALKAGNNEYASLEKAAVSASKALERAQSKGNFDPKAARSAAEASAALDAYGGTLKGLEAAAAKAGAEQARLQTHLANTQKIAKHVDDRNQLLNQRFEKLAQATALLPGPLRGVADGALRSARASHGLSVAFGETQGASILMVVGLAAAAAAVVAVTVAVIAGYAAFGKYAAGQADAARSAGLAREAFAALDPAAKSAVGAFGAVSDATGLTDAQLRGLAGSLREAHVSAAQMPKALRAAALAEAALGQGGASKFIERIKDGQDSVEGFARSAQAKFGGIVARQLLGLDAQGARFKKLWGGLFDSLNLEPVLGALKTLVDMFDKSNPLAQALSAVFKGLFEPVAKNAQAAAYAVEAFALGVAIQLTKAYIAFKPLLQGFDAFGLSVRTAKDYGEKFATALLIVGAGTGIVVAGLGILLAVALAIPVAFFALGYAIGTAIGGVIDWFSRLGARADAWRDEMVSKFVDIGAQLINGLVSGISSAAATVVDAVSSTVRAAIDTAKNLLGIHSPSTVFAEIGDNTAQGYAQGVEGGTPDAQRSMANLTVPPAGGGSAGAGGSAVLARDGTGGRGAVSVTIERLEIAGVAGAAEIAPRLAELLTQILEGDAAALAGA